MVKNSESRSVISKSLRPHRLYSPTQDYTVPNLGIEPRSPALQVVLYHLSQQESPPANTVDLTDEGLIPGWEDPLEEGKPAPVFLPGESYRQRSLPGYSP